MVGQIMDLSRSRVAGGFDVSFAPVELHELLSGVIDELRTANPEATIRLAGESLIGHWDRERLEQVFSNLIGNAIHNRLAQTPITVRTRHDGECARIEVHNEGPAIPEALRSTLFDPFRRGERSGREAKTAGLGLGLYISRQLVLAHGGELAVRSDAEHGTTFSATLPRTTSLTKAESHDTHGPVG